MAWRELDILKRGARLLALGEIADTLIETAKVTTGPDRERMRGAASCLAHYCALVRAHGRPPRDVPKALLAREAA